jgi:hypothetical protein
MRDKCPLLLLCVFRVCYAVGTESSTRILPIAEDIPLLPEKSGE